MTTPALSVIAGPKGSGKSTLTSSIWFEGNSNLIDPDRDSARHRPDSAGACCDSGNAAICPPLQSVAQRPFEFRAGDDACRSRGDNDHARGPQSRYKIFLVYVALKDPELHIERVRLRVSQGGHDIPDTYIRRRYARSLTRAPEALGLADEAVVLDNSGLHPMRMLLLKNGAVVWSAQALPKWVRQLHPFREAGK